jgi:hypothetical protein
MLLRMRRESLGLLLADLSDDYEEAWPKLRLFTYGIHRGDIYVHLTKSQVRQLRAISDRDALQVRYP